MNKNITFKFQKDYWFINDGKPANIDVLLESNVEFRERKLQKIKDRLNGIEHKYKEYSNSDIEYFRHILKKSRISDKLRCSVEKIVKNYE